MIREEVIDTTAAEGREPRLCCCEREETSLVRFFSRIAWENLRSNGSGRVSSRRYRWSVYRCRGCY